MNDHSNGNLPSKVGAFSTMEEFSTLDNASVEDVFPNVTFDIFQQFHQQNDDSLIFDPSIISEETQPAVTTASVCPRKSHGERKHYVI